MARFAWASVLRRNYQLQLDAPAADTLS